MRAFVGIDIGDSLRQCLASQAERIRGLLPSWADQKWVPPENLHITLKFLGDVQDAAIDTLAEELRSSLVGFDRFELPLEHMVAPIPRAHKATMLWTTLVDPDGRCASLHANVEAARHSVGVARETRTFIPHITLCRGRRPLPFDSELAAAHLDPPPTDAAVSVRAVTVYNSVLTRSRPYYERLVSVVLDD